MSRGTTVHRSFVLSGMGAMGTAVADVLISRGWRLAAGVDKYRTEAKLQWLTSRNASAPLLDSLADLDANVADLCVLTTNSTMAEVTDQIEQALDAGLNVVSSAEELAYPWPAHPELAARVSDRATQRNLAVLGTGINPGFMMDILPICLAVACHEVESISVQRTNDLSAFGESVLRSFGIGLSPDAFREALDGGDVLGHVGFTESLHMIADGAGLTFDTISERVEPIISRTRRTAGAFTVAPGEVAGCTQIATAVRDGVPIIRLRHPQQVEPAAEGVTTEDTIEIVGKPSISMTIAPEVAGGDGTVALLANTADFVADPATCGLLSMLDVPLQRLRRADGQQGHGSAQVPVAVAGQ